jgi:hypothetical protein
MRKRVRQLPWPCFLVALSAAWTLGACGAAGQTNVGTGGGTSVAPVSTSLPSPNAPTVSVSTLTEIAKSAASGSGDPNVTSAEVVLTTEDGAKAVMGGLDDPSKPIYLLQMKGNFADKGYSGPPGSHVPTGSYIILEVDASSGEVFGYGIQTVAANLASIGTVVTLQL